MPDNSGQFVYAEFPETFPGISNIVVYSSTSKTKKKHMKTIVRFTK